MDDETRELIREGTLCQVCAAYVGGDAGFLQTCAACIEREHEEAEHEFPCGNVGCYRRFTTAEARDEHQTDAWHHLPEEE